MNTLSLLEEAFLMCIRKDGNFGFGMFGKCALEMSFTAAIMMELTRQNKIEFVGDNKFRLVNENLNVNKPESIISDAIKLIGNNKEGLTMSEWIRKINGGLIFNKGIKNMKDRVIESLISKNILTKKNGLVFDSIPFASQDIQSECTTELRDILVNVSNIPLSQEAGFDHPSKSIDDQRNDDDKLFKFAKILMFKSLYDPFKCSLENAIDLKRILPDRSQRKLIENNMKELFINRDQFDNAQFACIASISNEFSKYVKYRMMRVYCKTALSLRPIL